MVTTAKPILHCYYALPTTPELLSQKGFQAWNNLQILAVVRNKEQYLRTRNAEPLFLRWGFLNKTAQMRMTP